jgi:hypothetical protein
MPRPASILFHGILARVQPNRESELYLGRKMGNGWARVLAEPETVAGRGRRC